MSFDHFAADITNLPQVLATLRRRAGALGIDEAIQSILCIVAEELFLNTVHHSTDASRVALALTRSTEVVTLVYEDTGAAYDPFANVDRSVLHESGDTRRTGGLGIILVEQLATTARYENVDQTNRITLTFAT